VYRPERFAISGGPHWLEHMEERIILVLLRLLRNIQVQPAFCGGGTGSVAVLLCFVQPASERRRRSMCARYLRSEMRDNLCDQCQITRKPTACRIEITCVLSLS
jgi:hypothetical protein